MCDNDDSEEPALLLSLVKKEQLQRVLAHVLDENKFLSPYGIRSLSKVVHRKLYMYINYQLHIGKTLLKNVLKGMHH